MSVMQLPRKHETSVDTVSWHDAEPHEIMKTVQDCWFEIAKRGVSTQGYVGRYCRMSLFLTEALLPYLDRTSVYEISSREMIKKAFPLLEVHVATRGTLHPFRLVIHEMDRCPPEFNRMW